MHFKGNIKSELTLFAFLDYFNAQVSILPWPHFGLINIASKKNSASADVINTTLYVLCDKNSLDYEKNMVL